MKKLKKESEQIVDKVVDNMQDDESKELTDLLEKYNISNGIIMLTMFGIGTHTEYYKVLVNRIKNNKDQVNDNWVKQQALEIFHDIDRNEEE
jgi:2,3-bisphosphoglycerate-independent phosphoglycerate mutase